MSAKALREAAKAVDDFRDEAYGFFPDPPPEFNFKLLDRWLLDTFGFRIDRLSAEFYRRALTVGAGHLRRMADDLADSPEETP